MLVFGLSGGYVVRTVPGDWVSPGWFLLRGPSAVFAGWIATGLPLGQHSPCESAMSISWGCSPGVRWGITQTFSQWIPVEWNPYGEPPWGTIRGIPHIGRAGSPVESRMGRTLQRIFLFGK